MYDFNAADAAEKCIDWIREWFAENGPDSNAVIGISGGKDSSVAAALCVRALGPERVIGVMLPQGEQPDIDFAIELCDFLHIRKLTINIKPAADGVYEAVDSVFSPSEQSRCNLPARLRMTLLYMVAGSFNGRVANTCNLSEDWVGYATRYGDGAGDFGPLSNFTVEEIRKIGFFLGLPKRLVEKPPLDGLCGKTDEENLGFSYQCVDDYIRRGKEPEGELKARIDGLHERNRFKLKYMDCFNYFK